MMGNITGMGKEKEEKAGSTGRRSSLNIGISMSCGAELKLLMAATILLCTFFTTLHLIPYRSCVVRSVPLSPLIATSAAAGEEDPPDPGVEVRAFNTYGATAYSFITMGSYRGGTSTFAVVGLSSKPLQVYSHPTYLCQWYNGRASGASLYATGQKMLPDWGYGRVYTVVVVNCSFGVPVNLDSSGGTLVLHASSSEGGDKERNVTETIEVLKEEEGVDVMMAARSAPMYDYLYCGSPLYGRLSPQRVREWLAYHVRLMGDRSHFVMYDAGGVHEKIRDVLRPWMDLGYVALEDIRSQERFDGYYHNQFLVVNDCLHRYKLQTKWMFFFDLDEYIYVAPGNTLRSVFASFKDMSQITIEQMPMSASLCLAGDYGRYHRKWGIEKLVYRDVKRGIRRDRKYAVQPRNVFATGVHLSQNLAGNTTHRTGNKIRYFHYHGTIAQRKEPCRQLLNATKVMFREVPYVLDTTMRNLAWSVKKFELHLIGSTLQNTSQ